LPLAFAHYSEPDGRDITYVGFSKATDRKYEYGPIEEEDEPLGPPAKSPSKPATKSKAPFDPVRVREGKDLMLRDTFLLAWFLDGTIAKTRKAMAGALDKYVAFVPPDMLRWALIGSSSTDVRAASSSTVSRAHTALKKPHAYFWLGSDDEPEIGKAQKDEPHCPAFMINASGDDHPPCVLEMRFASDFVWQIGVENMIAFATEITKDLQVVSGYGSLHLATHPMITSFSSAQRRAAGPFLVHAGYDVAANGSTDWVLEGKSRGARWLTILGPKLAAKVKPALAKTGAELIAAGRNLIVRAGAEPAPDPTGPLLGKVARALRPVTLFNDSFVQGYFADPKTWEADPLKYAAWEFRFLGGLAGAIAYLESQRDRASKQRLLEIRIAQGKYTVAQKAFDVVAKAGSKDRELGSELLAMSKLAETAKRKADALAWMLRFRDSDKSNTWALRALGELHQRLGNKAEAKAQLDAYNRREGNE
ncbi:MAG: DUF3396 domain-containing protein, partial [Deltaproteobacteria bacterium]|nr:DUF3396 domain-containing protein [Deltaproteobacteria bacterium]